MDLLEQIVLGNSLEKWLLAAGIVVVGTVVLNIFTRILARTFNSLNKKVTSDFPRVLAEMFRRTKKTILFLIILYAASTVLQ
ncbi:MAG: hypothetical protein R6U40_08345, partial [Desulfobacterales bacterium]